MDWQMMVGTAVCGVLALGVVSAFVHEATEARWAGWVLVGIGYAGIALAPCIVIFLGLMMVLA